MKDRVFRAVIFDLDGTLADSLLDFDAIRAEIGLAPGCRFSSSWPTRRPPSAPAPRRSCAGTS